ncbi:MAG: S41 family peptidase [Bacteroidales bacterium]|nr:S41 family peptidase [Bacteroidales bacterium]MDD3209481.1 S41 family peptidase [Bacteroidales bacterium]MDD3698093.1 S41 family peptidase [Bacteroidales bacterium]MDD4168629.1 S41 family peptidase [Bacteroidales bacterium]MDD4474069.1 S41 family peptidase [Bacteroidales bacterium]
MRALKILMFCSIFCCSLNFITAQQITANYKLPDNMTVGEKIYGLSKLWQEVNYNFVYLDKVDREGWNKAYQSAIQTVMHTTNDYEYYRELQKFCALLKDGHTNVYLPERIDTLIYNSDFGNYRLFLENVEGEAIIVRVNQSKKDELPVGSRILEVNRIPVWDYIDQYVAPNIGSSTEYVLKDLAVMRLLEGPVGATYTIKIQKPDGTPATLDLKHERSMEKEVYPSLEPDKLMDFKMYDQIAYVALNSFRNNGLDSLFAGILPQLSNAKGLIIDLRLNSGGSTNVGVNILEYITSDTLFYGPVSMSREHIPVFKAWGSSVRPQDTTRNDWRKKCLLYYQDKMYYTFDYSPWVCGPKSQRFVKPTVILTGHLTASAAEDFLVFADNQEHIIRMGEKTYGSTGQPFVFDLPGGGFAIVCTKKDVFKDGREFVGYGIVPHITVKRTLQDYLDQKDVVLEKALKYLSEFVLFEVPAGIE